MLLWGASAFLAALVPKDLAELAWRRLGIILLGAGIFAVATCAAALPLETAYIGSGWSDALAPAMLRSVLIETNVGWAWQLQAVATVLLIAAFAIPLPRRMAAVALASGLLLASLALTGHAVVRAGGLGIAHRINDALHVLASGAWVGALVPLLVVLRQFESAEFYEEGRAALRRFSTAGHLAVAIVIATGVASTLLVLGHWPIDWTSPYQAMLAAKIALAAVMVALAIFNRYALVPQIPDRPELAARSIRRGTIAEIVLALCVTALVSVLGMLETA